MIGGLVVWSVRSVMIAIAFYITPNEDTSESVNKQWHCHSGMRYSSIAHLSSILAMPRLTEKRQRCIPKYLWYSQAKVQVHTKAVLSLERDLKISDMNIPTP
jgi:hypothetical protein